MTTPSFWTRRAALAVVALGAATLIGACAALAPRDIALSRADLQTLVERQFPREQRLMEMLDVSLLRPQVRLLPERNRIATALDVSAKERITGRTLRGSLAIEHALRYEASDATLRLAHVKVSDIKLDVGGSPLGASAARLGSMLAERMLDDFVVYRVSEEKREALRRAGVQAATFAVTERGVEVRFAEKP
jgi:hypothetical protein